MLMGRPPIYRKPTPSASVRQVYNRQYGRAGQGGENLGLRRIGLGISGLRNLEGLLAAVCLLSGPIHLLPAMLVTMATSRSVVIDTILAAIHFGCLVFDGCYGIARLGERPLAITATALLRCEQASKNTAFILRINGHSRRPIAPKYIAAYRGPGLKM
jgi:hypothetical protein